jgi:adenylate cyclase
MPRTIIGVGILRRRPDASDRADSSGVTGAFDDLLAGLDGEVREARLRLLEHLRDEGCSVEELRQAAAEDRLALLPVDRALQGRARYTLAEVAERSGVDAETLQVTRRAFGLPLAPAPDVPAFGEGDLELATGLRAVLDGGVPVEGVVELNRVVGRAMRQVAAASRTRPSASGP